MSGNIVTRSKDLDHLSKLAEKELLLEKARRGELTERAKAIVAEDPGCWPEDLVAELGFCEKSEFKATP